MRPSDCQAWTEDGRILEAWPMDDRGLAYGDGVFETMRIHAGELPWLARHLARLCRGGQRLGLRLPDATVMRQRIAGFIAGRDGGVCKLIVTRGGAGRGYAPSAQVGCRMMLAWQAAPAPLQGGLAVDVLGLRLAPQPALAGIKHLNRLEQVLGAMEVQQRGLDDGLMLDGDGHVVCSTRANLFLHVDGRWLTPALQACGIAGVTRAVLLEHLPCAAEAALPLADLRRAGAAFLCNAVRGIMPVRRLGALALDTGLCQGPRSVLADQHPAFIRDGALA